MATEWFDRKPGSMVGVQSGTAPNEPTMVVVGVDDAPDWVRMPVELSRDRRALRVLDVFQAPCPKCRGHRQVRHLQLQDHYGVAECTVPACGFVWYQLAQKEDA